MTLFDWILIAIVVVGALYGYRRGLIASLGSLVGIVAAIILCRVFAESFAESFNSPDDTAQTRLLHTVLSYVLIFVVCYVGVRLVARLCASTVSALSLGGIDKLAGAVFKVFEWALIYSIFLNLWLMIMPQTKIDSSRSKLTTAVLNFAPNILGSETAEEVYRSIDALSDKAEEAAPKDSTQQSVGDNVRDAAIERIIGEVVDGD